MKAQTIRYVAPHQIECVELDVPDPGPGEVQVRTRACGICAWDLNTFRHGPQAPYPAPPGHEGCGVVTQVGPGVTQLKVGDNVCSVGFQSVSNRPAAGLYKLPDRIRDYRLWIVEPVACVVNGLDRAAIEPGARVAVVGCGFMGLLHVQALRHAMLTELVGVDVDARKLELARRCGAERVYHSVHDKADLDRLEMHFDVVIEAAGAQPALDLAVRLVKRGGMLSLFSWHHGPRTFDGDLWHTRGINVRCTSPSNAPYFAKLWEPTIRMIDRGLFNLDPLVTHTGPLDRLRDLLEAGVSGQTGYVKGVVLYD